MYTKKYVEEHKYNLEGADLRAVDLTGAYLKGADLSYANLAGANLASANLRGADLSYANLAGANLGNADLWGADLTDTIISSPLHYLKALPPETALRYWKYLDSQGLSPYYHTRYEVGKTYEFVCNTDERVLCAEGGNVATLKWCLRDDCISTNQFIEVEFKVSDIGAIPYATDGKFRVRKFTVLWKISRAEALLEEGGE